MLTKAQEKLILSLHTRKGRARSGKCLVEGKKNIEAAGDAVEFTFRNTSTKNFSKLVTTDTPQPVAAVAAIPHFSDSDINTRATIVVLDGVQDPGNVGSILRLCQGFHASLLLVECADVTNPKVVRASAGALFSVPWKDIARDSTPSILSSYERPVYRLEKNKNAVSSAEDSRIVLIAGSEGSGVTLPVKGASLSIQHDAELESLNVGHALAIILANRYSIS